MPALRRRRAHAKRSIVLLGGHATSKHNQGLEKEAIDIPAADKGRSLCPLPQTDLFRDCQLFGTSASAPFLADLLRRRLALRGVGAVESRNRGKGLVRVDSEAAPAAPLLFPIDLTALHACRTQQFLRVTTASRPCLKAACAAGASACRSCSSLHTLPQLTCSSRDQLQSDLPRGLAVHGCRFYAGTVDLEGRARSQIEQRGGFVDGSNGKSVAHLLSSLRWGETTPQPQKP